MENSDGDIIQKCLNGNIEVFSELVTRYKRLIYGVASHLVGDSQEAYDLSQEAFLKIFKSLNQYKPEYQFSTWAVTITTNLCLDWKRRQKARAIPLEEVQEFIGGIHTPESEYLKQELKQRVRTALDELPDQYRTPLILFYQAGLSYEELTEILKEPMSIIKNRLYRGRLMLKDRLSPKRKEIAQWIANNGMKS